MRSDLVDLTLFVHHETADAVLVSDDGVEKNAKWLPKSQIEVEPLKGGREAIVTMPEWLATERGFV